MKRTILTIACSLFFFLQDLAAQCSMCKASLESNVNNGEVGMAARLNVGILYLFFLPYLLVATLAVLWYVKSKRNKQQAILKQSRKRRLSQLGL